MLEHVDISHLSGYKTPAQARYFIEYDGHNFDALREATRFAYSNDLPILTIAGGRNSLLAFSEYPGLVIYNNAQGYRLEKIKWNDPITPAEAGVYQERSEMDSRLRGNDGERCDSTTMVSLEVQSWHPIWELAEELEKKHGIDLWHRFQGLPGSIGGAVYWNAGCFGLDIGPYVSNVDIFDMKNGERFSKTGAELNFQYRWSECKNHPEWFLLSIVCDLSQKIEKYPAPEEDPLAWRERVQPEGLSCGSFFKNPSREQTAGLLLEQVGLKWYRQGGAYFSEKHANFLMSDGTATGADLVALIELAQKKVFEQTGIQLEPEVRIIKTQ
jgi:UDP-N-acetylenolpyruvoylglucosamine reductase